MVNLEYDNHLEVQLVKNKPKEKPPVIDPFLILIILFAASILIPVLGPIDVFNNNGTGLPQVPPTEDSFPPSATPNSSSGDSSSQIPATSPDSLSDITNNRSVEVSDPDPRVITTGSIQINTCNEHPAAANFRAYPNYSPNVIKGVVEWREWVYLTGITAYGDGIRWYQAMNYLPLRRSEDVYEIYDRSQRNQIGWIAACFVE